MSANSLQKKILHFVFLCLLQFSYGQITNKEIIAEIKTSKTEGFVNIKATVKSKTQIIKSLRYVMYVIKVNAETSNSNRGEQSGRFVLKPNENKELSSTSINQNIKDKVTVLLLIYDTEDNLVAKDRLVVLNDDGKGVKKETIKQKQENVSSQEAYNFTGFRGIVTEDTRTKPGRDFYKMFYSDYLLKSIKGERVVKISEQFSLGSNTIVSIHIDNQLVYQFNVQPRTDYLMQQSNQAILAVSNYFQRLEQQKAYITRNNN